jgi:hypothetical protein
MAIADKNHDGQIDLEEFKSAVLAHQVFFFFLSYFLIFLIL